MAVNISAKFGKDSELYNGLEAIAEQMLAEPHKTWTVIATVRPKFVKEDLEAGGVTPTIKVLQIEPIIGERDEGQAKRLQIAAFKRRTHNTDAPSWDPPQPPPSLFDDQVEDPEGEPSEPVENPATDDGWDDEEAAPSEDANEEDRDDNQSDESDDTAPAAAFSHTEPAPATGKRRGRA